MREPFYHHRSATQYSALGGHSKSIDYSQQKEKKLEKVKYNKEQNQKQFQNKIDRIARRSVKREEHASKCSR